MSRKILLTCLAACALSAPAAAAPAISAVKQDAGSAEVSTAPSAADVVAALFDAINAHDADAAAALYAEDAVVSGPDHPPLQGREAIRAHFQNVFNAVPTLNDQPRRAVASGNLVAVEFIASWETSEGRAGFPIASFIEVRDGLIVNDTAYFDAN